MVYSIILTTILSFIFIKLLISHAYRFKLIDKPNDRSTHTKSVPLGAGLGFILAMLIGTLNYDSTLLLNNWYIFVAIFMVLSIGFIDDILHISPKSKIFIIGIATLILWYKGINIPSLGNYFGQDISLGWFSLPFTLFAIIGFTNSLNLIDGIDGLASMVSFLILGFFSYIGYLYADSLILSLSLLTMASLTAFIFFNYHPAQIFMGDSGSLSLGFIIAIVALLSLKYVEPITAIFLTALPLYDTLTVVIRRYKKGIPIMNPDKTHIHHILLRFFGDRNFAGKRTNGNRRTAWLLVLVQLLFSSLGLMIHLLIPQYPFISFLGVILFIIGFILIYKLVTKIEMIESRKIL